MEIKAKAATVEVLYFPGNISLDMWSDNGNGEVICATLTPEDALMVATALQKAAMAEIEL